MSDTWRRRAACRDMAVSLFFDEATEAQSRRVCSGCPVTDACLAFARHTSQAYGVWGGMTPAERSRRRRRPRLAPTPVSLAPAHVAATPVAAPLPAGPSIADVMVVAARVLGVHERSFLLGRGPGLLSTARAIAMSAARIATGASYVELGAAFRRTPTWVSTQCRAVDQDEALKRRAEHIASEALGRT